MESKSAANGSGDTAVLHRPRRSSSGWAMPFSSKASPGWLRKNPRTEAFASAGGWLTAAVSTLLASGWPSRYPLAAFSTPLEVAASPLAEHGSGAAPAVGATITHRTQPGITPKIVRHNDFLTASSLRPLPFECSVDQLPTIRKARPHVGTGLLVV